MEQFLIILAEFGLPVAGSFAMGVFIYIILRYILGSVIGQVQTMHSIITQLDVPPDEERIARADGKKDARRD